MGQSTTCVDWVGSEVEYSVGGMKSGGHRGSAGTWEVCSNPSLEVGSRTGRVDQTTLEHGMWGPS